MLKKYKNKICYQKVKQNLFISGPRKHPVRMFHIKFGFDWPSGFREEDL